MKVHFALALTMVLGWLAADARAQQQQPPDKKEQLEQLTEQLEGAKIRLQIAKVKDRIAQAEGKATKQILAYYDERLKIYDEVKSGRGGLISREDYLNTKLTRDKYALEAIQKEGAAELGQLEVRYRAWQFQRLENAIKRLKPAEKK